MVNDDDVAVLSDMRLPDTAADSSTGVAGPALQLYNTPRDGKWMELGYATPGIVYVLQALERSHPVPENPTRL